MNSRTAEALALKIAQTWSRGPAPDIWQEILTPLHHNVAEEAYSRLRIEARHPPAIADFMDRYRGLLGSARSHDAEPDCLACADLGWVTCNDHPHHGGHWTGREDRRPVMRTAEGPQPTECICSIVRPCRCESGQRQAQLRTTHHHQAA